MWALKAELKAVRDYFTNEIKKTIKKNLYLKKIRVL